MVSPSLTSIGIGCPSFAFLEPGPTAITLPSAVCPCVSTLSGSIIPLAVCSCLSGFLTKKDYNFMEYHHCTSIRDKRCQNLSFQTLVT